MAIGDDFSVNAAGDIRHTSGTTTYTVLELHRWLQDLADNAAASGDDILDITKGTPSERSTDNIITLLAPYNIDDTAAEFLYDGSITQAGGDVVYSGLVVVGSLASTTTLKVIQDNLFYDDQATPFWGTGLNQDAGANILLRIMVKTRVAGADVDGKRVRVHARTYGDTYAEFSATLGLGNAVAAIFTNTDLNNQTASGTVAGWTINNTEGYQLIDVNNDGTGEPYYSKWDRVSSAGGSGGINDIYEWAKYLQRSATATTIHGMNGELFRGITHEFAYSTEVGGPFTEDEELTWGTGATEGSGILLALLDSGTTGSMWIQLLTGVSPSNAMTITGVGSSATCAVNGTVTSRTVSPCFLGQSTGSALIGAFGIGVDTGDLLVSDLLFDLTDTQRQPPNNQSFTVGGLISGEDRVLVGPKDTGNDYEFDQLLTSGIHTNASTTVTVSTTIPSDTPNTGTIRIEDSNGIYQRMTYTGWTGTTFTGCVGSGSWTSPTTSNLFISYIDVLAGSDEASYTAVYSASRSLWVRVRDGGASPIKTFQTAGTFGAGGGSVTAIRTSDE